jgi:hypothetical protein
MQTTAVLPDGFTVRPPETSDAEAMFDMLAAYNTAVVGFADCTLEETAYCIGRPGFERTTDGWLVLGEDGLPAGYATALGEGDREVVGIEVASQDPAVAGWLLEQTMRRARAMGSERGHAEVTIDAFVYRDDEPLRALLADHGFTTGTTYHRMRIDHTGAVAAPEVPAGVVVRRGALDEATRVAPDLGCPSKRVRSSPVKGRTSVCLTWWGGIEARLVPARDVGVGL